MSFLKEFIRFMLIRKKYWLFPIMFILFIFGLLIILSHGTAVAPFIYTIFNLVKYILGISAFYHDSSATLIKNGEIISAVQEERFTRIKHDSVFPKQSIKYILKSNSLELNQIDKIIFYEKPFLKFERLIETYLAFAPKGIKQFCLSMPLWLREKLFQKNLILKELKYLDKNFKKKTNYYFVNII